MKSDGLRAGETPEERLTRLYAEYVDRLNSGGPVDFSAILREHPDVGEELVDELRLMQDFDFGDTTDANEPLGALGDYTLRRQIGRGGMGVVYDAWQSSVDRQVALKVLPAGVAADERALQRFVREARTAAQLHHPNVVGVFGMGVESNTPYYAMEFVEGETLAQVLDRLRDAAPEADTPFGSKDELAYFGNLAKAFAKVADGLQHAHAKGVVHRDIKPSNLILDLEGRVRILDFGLATLEGQESLTVSGDIVGTPLYMSPEQARRHKVRLDHRTDLYSLGATLYEMLCGRPPFRGKDHADTLSQIIAREPTAPHSSNARVPGDLETIVLKCLRKDPSDRYGTAEALGQDLRRFARGEAIEARRESRWGRAAARLRPHRGKLLVATAFVVLLSALGWIEYRRQEAEYRRAMSAYKPAVVEALKKIYAGRFSLEVIAGQTVGILGATDDAPTPVRPEDLGVLFHGYGFSSVEAAVEGLREQTVALPAERDAHYHLARAHFVLGRLEAARAAIDRALVCDPDFVPARALAWELSGGSLDDLDRIVTEYEARVDWQRDWVVAYWNVQKGRATIGSFGAWIRAASAYGELLARQAKEEPYIGCFAETYLNRGVARLESGEPFLAQRDFINAEARGAGIASRLLEAKAFHLADQKRETDRIFEELCSTGSLGDESQCFLWIAGVYNHLSDYKAGLAWAEKLPEDLPIRARLQSAFLFQLGDVAAALQAGRTALALDSGDVQAHLILATGLLKDHWAGGAPRLERLAEIFGHARAAAELQPENGVARGLLTTATAEAHRALLRLLRRWTLESRGPLRSLCVRLLALCAGTTSLTPRGYFDEIEFIDVGLRGANCIVTTSADELVVYFTHYPDGNNPRNNPDIYFMTRETKEEPFVGPAEPLEGVNTVYEEWIFGGSLSADGSTLYFSSNRPGGPGKADIWSARFDRPGDPRGGFHDIQLVAGINTPGWEAFSAISRDGERLYLRTGPTDVWVAQRQRDEQEERFADAILVSARLGGPDVLAPSFSADERTIFWGEVKPRDGGHGFQDIWMARRERIVDDDSRPVPFDGVFNPGPPVSTGLRDFFAHVTADWPGPGSGLYLSRFFTWNDTAIYRLTWHPDCNENHLDDPAEIEAGLAEDIDGDGVPDE